MEKLYHGCNQRQSPFAEHENTFWVYPSIVKLENKWDTHLSPHQYCNNHKEFGYSKYNPSLKEFVCLGHTRSEDFLEAQKEWKSMNWDLHVVGLVERIKQEEDKQKEQKEQDKQNEQEKQKEQTTNITEQSTNKDIVTIEQRLERLETKLNTLIQQETNKTSVIAKSGVVNYEAFLIVLVLVLLYYYIRYVPTTKELVISSREIDL